MITYFTHADSPVGQLLLASNGTAITQIRTTGGEWSLSVPPDWLDGSALPPLEEARGQLDAYFAGSLTQFDLPLAPSGSAFQKSVWAELARVSYGSTISYGELARRIGAPGSARAVGLANSRNPIAIVIPCHRVVGADGSLTGYAGGLERKKVLLALEAGRLPGLV